MYLNPIDQPPDEIHEFVSARKNQFQKPYDSARMSLNFNQKRRNALYTREVHRHTYQDDQKLSLLNPVVSVGKLLEIFKPWKDPYVILESLNDGTYRIQEIETRKTIDVH